MGKKQTKVKRVVLDTNVLVSALLFTGKLSRIPELWQKRKIIPLISKETFDEFKTVLSYPKFSLSPEEIQGIIENEILPYFEVVKMGEKIMRISRDPEDDKFIACAIDGSADFIVSGDKDLTDLKSYQTVRILGIRDFLRMLK
ncbi:MAG: putative toxin-antitoxin system toxin component, PIN family [Syntrophaceae bacterium]|nr:putative toxin-antitoxin system toxin component, PIN family [Syntrophaceae bacterium]